MITGLPTAPLASRLINQRAAAPWITLPRKAPLIDNKILSKQTGPALATLARIPVLFIDDVDLKTMRPPADEDFHDHPAEPRVREATLDRPRYNAACLSLDGASYRSPKKGAHSPKSCLVEQARSEIEASERASYYTFCVIAPT